VELQGYLVLEVMKRKWIALAVLSIVVGGFISVRTIDWKSKKKEHSLFSLISPDSSGVHFSNDINTTDSLNIFSFEYIYNGGGVGIGDFNRDGKPDIFFVGNKVPSRLYLNQGHFHFKDITESSGIHTDGGWAFGVSVVDINQDGWPDIYVSMGGPGNEDIYPNKLFINQGLDKNGNPWFKEMAKEYGLDDPGQSIQAVFFDYDHDGDLDMYLLTGGGFEKSPIVPHPIIKDGSARNTDRLYRNDFDKKLGHPVFTNVSSQAGILEEGFGLGVSILDINEDGWPDVYVTNDYLSNDLLYVNNRNGTFTERSAEYFKHTSHFAMGNDVGDINNDGLMDIIAVDMLPDRRYDRMLMFGPNQYNKFFYSIEQGYSYQYMRNTLQLNQGKGRFSEIGQLAGIYKTSWSWSPMFADLDNDGYQDLFISNGFGKNVTDLDFVKFRTNVTNTADKNTQIRSMLDSLSARPGIRTHNYAYRNKHDYTFEDVSDQWGFSSPTYSNGTAYVDLDGDGALDIVTNNMDEPARIFRNTVRDSKNDSSHYLRIRLSGDSGNIAGIGSMITLKYDGQIQRRYLSVVRGFESCVEDVAHFGLGRKTSVDTLEILWPDGKNSLLRNVKADQELVVRCGDFVAVGKDKEVQTGSSYFSQLPARNLGISYVNRPNSFNDFNYEKLLPKKYSQNGQGICVGDLNGDGLEDFFAGGAYNQPGQIYIQNRNGSFSRHDISKYSDASEDAGSLLFDADGDGDLDLIVISGGNEFTSGNKRYQPRLYKNDGKGNFKLDSTALPKMTVSGSCVVAADFDGDGDLDLFIGGRVIPGKYPAPPDSWLLRNDGGRFTDVTDELAPGLRKTGMVTSALWTDIDNDGKPDLILAGEWMPVTVFKNEGGRFVNITATDGLQATEGWWQGMVAGDFDNDGDIDYIIGNWGLNSPYLASATAPMSVCFKDFDHDGFLDPIIGYYEEGVNYPAAPWDYMIQEMPTLRKRISTYAGYAATDMKGLLSMLDTTGMQTLYCRTLQSVLLENLGGGKFRLRALPVEAQVAPLFGMVTEDVNNDGNLDLLAVGDFYGTDVVTGRYDALKGLVLLGDGKGNFKPATSDQSGFVADGDSKAFVRIESAGKRSFFLVGQLGDSIKIFEDRTSGGLQRVFPAPGEATAIAYTTGNKERKIELGLGASYLSQSSRAIVITKDIRQINFFDRKGSKTRSLIFGARGTR
jgi:hypothetical protein